MRRLLADLLWGIGVVLCFAAAAFAIFGTAFAWVLKDGLGPDSVQSTGWDAVQSLCATMLPLMAIIVPVSTLGSLSHWLSRRWEPEAEPPSRAIGWPRAL